VRALLVLSRPRGAPIHASTLDLALHGTRIMTLRPLGVNERLAFDLDLDDDQLGHVRGSASVLREHAGNVYALRFEQLSEPAATRLSSYLAARTNSD
jgi:hypothetical protein